MPQFELNSFSSPEELAGRVAAQWRLEVQARKSLESPYCVALSGGRITRGFFSAAAKQAKDRSLSLDSVHFFWADERCVPPTDPECNFAIARELLFAPLGIPEAQVHRIRGEDPPEAAAIHAEAEICRLAPLDGEGQPVLDLIFLGMGEDGHVASLFPGEPEAVMASKAVYRPVTAAKPPPRRITLGYSAIAAARQVWVLVSGPGKENALRESLSPVGLTPLARVLCSRAHTRIFTDLPS